PVLALHTPLLEMDGLRLRELCTTCTADLAAIEISSYGFAEIVFHGIQWGARKELPIWKRSQSIPVTGNTHNAAHMAVPRCNIRIQDWPINRKAVPIRPFEIIRTPPLRLPRPHQGFAPHLITPYPIKIFFLDIGMFIILHKEML